jgi:hypothetical protein
MKKTFYAFGLLLLVAACPADSNLPKGWFKAGDSPTKYDMYLDKNTAQNGKSCATIKSTFDKIDGFGTLMQDCKPDNYLGKRVRMSGYIKSKDIDDWAGFWLRVDQKNSVEPLSFDNMESRAIKGTTDWKKYDIVLDVPSNASNIAFGALVAGTGQIWFDNLSFEVVSDTVKTTGGAVMDTRKINDAPTNLNFEE